MIRKRYRVPVKEHTRYYGTTQAPEKYSDVLEEDDEDS